MPADITARKRPGASRARPQGSVTEPLLSSPPTPKRAARVITRVLAGESDATGTYYDENGTLMKDSEQVSDPACSDRCIAESRKLLAAVPAAQERR